MVPGQAEDREPEGVAPPAHDPHRPRYHYLPPSGWMNDPNGLIQWGGDFHMFYQYNPQGAFHGAIQWGHTVSPDLVHWTDLPIALSPTPGGPDEGGCWSGCAVDDGGMPTIVYSGYNSGPWQQTCIATSTDGLRTWEKYAGNPVLAGPPAGLEVVAFRDHSVWREDDTWYQVIGSGIADRGGTALLYRSADLRQWQYLHPLCVGDLNQREPLWTGTMWECPDFFALGSHHVLVVSVWHDRQVFYPIYFTGRYTDRLFAPEQMHRLDFGASFYAPQSFTDAHGRRIMFGWLREERDDGEQIAAGWSGVMSLPRVLALRADGMLDMRPAPELERLRAKHVTVQGGAITAGAPRVLDEVSGHTLEIRAELAPGDATEIGIAMRRSPDGREQTAILYDCPRQQLVIDVSESGSSASTQAGRHAGPLVLADGETLRLRIFVDRSVVEVFANDRACATARIYPSRDDSLGIALFARSGEARLVSLEAWEMQSI